MKKDLRDYSIDELSLIVFNTEYFYRIRHAKADLMDALKAEYIFTEEQEQVLFQDIEDDEEQIEED